MTGAVVDGRGGVATGVVATGLPTGRVAVGRLTKGAVVAGRVVTGAVLGVTGDGVGGIGSVAVGARWIKGPPVGATGAGRGKAVVVGGAPFSMRVRSAVAGAVCWAVRARAARRCNMTGIIAPQPPNGKLRST